MKKSLNLIQQIVWKPSSDRPVTAVNVSLVLLLPMKQRISRIVSSRFLQLRRLHQIRHSAGE